jgi:hypothetical protein
MKTIIKELTKVNMRNIIVFAILIVWGVGFLNGILSKNAFNDTQADALAKLDTVMLMIIGYYLNQKSNTETL